MREKFFKNKIRLAPPDKGLGPKTIHPIVDVVSENAISPFFSSFFSQLS